MGIELKIIQVIIIIFLVMVHLCLIIQPSRAKQTSINAHIFYYTTGLVMQSQRHQSYIMKTSLNLLFFSSILEMHTSLYPVRDDPTFSDVHQQCTCLILDDPIYYKRSTFVHISSVQNGNPDRMETKWKYHHLNSSWRSIRHRSLIHRNGPGARFHVDIQCLSQDSSDLSMSIS